MIELTLNHEQWLKFTAEAKKKMGLKGWSLIDLSIRTGRPIGSIRNFFTKGNSHSRFLAAEIANVLGMNGWN